MVAGSLGAAARYGVDTAVRAHTGGSFPWGIFIVNVTASLLLGLVFTIATRRAGIDEPTRLTMTTGFIGSYSTFSTLMLDAVRLAQDGALGLAVLNAGGSLVAGLVAVTVGMLIGRAA